VQQLHLVGFTTDHKGLILGTRRGTDEGSFVVTLDRAFVEQIEELLRLQAGESGETTAGANGTAIPLRRPKAESKLTPREVQALLRTGRSVFEVAEAAGMSEDWVGRFAPPILAEQARVTDRATGLIYLKPRIGPSIQPLGESVIWNLAERGIVLSGTAVDDAWTAFQQPDGAWVVRVSYLAERRRQHADWTIDMAQGVLKAVNRLANELAYVEPGRRRPAALPPATPASASAQRAAAAPPKPPPPPPLPPRPSGRLSLLGSGAGGLGRQNPPARVAARDYLRESVPTPAPPRPDTGKEPTRSRRDTPEESVRRLEEKPEESARSRRDNPEEPARSRAEKPAAGAPPPTRTPPDRRERPLRPRSPDAPSNVEAPPAPARAAPARDKARDKSAAQPPADGGDRAEAPSSVRPKRERPLRAPSRIRRDELAEPPPVARRPVLAPRDSPARSNPPGSSSTEPVAPRRSPNSPTNERRTSPAERFGPDLSGGHVEALISEVVTRTQFSRVAVAEPPEAVPNHIGSPDRRAGAARPLQARPLRAQRVARETEPDDSEPLDLVPEPASLRAGRRAPDVDEVYRAFANLEVDDPITAPVPAVELVGDDGESVGKDQVFIRAGQAGAADPSSDRASVKARPADDDRQGRPGRLKLRRRSQGST
jgi:hypothetical protein